MNDLEGHLSSLELYDFLGNKVCLATFLKITTFAVNATVYDLEVSISTMHLKLQVACTFFDSCINIL